MSQPKRIGRIELAALCFVSVLALVHAASFLGAGPIDDDFILYRYGHQVLQGHGLVFQEGSRAEGFTTPLYLAWISLGLSLGQDPVRWSVTTGVVACALACAALARAWQATGEGSHTFPWPALVLAAAPTFAWHGVAGLGTTCLAACLILWFADLLRERWMRCGLWLALACALRQEAALFLPGLVFCLAKAEGGKRWRALLPALLVLVGWSLFRRLYFGTWVPVTYAVKKLPLTVDLAYGWDYLLGSTLQCGVLLLLLLLVLVPRQRAWLALAASLWLHTLYVVYVGGDWMPWSRFFMPTLPLLIWGALHAVRRWPPAFALLCALMLVGPQWLQLDAAREGRAQRFFSHQFFEQRWKTLGEALGRDLDPQTTVGLSPIGAFGWYSQLPLVDLLGLTHPDLVGVAPDLTTRVKGHHRSDAEWALRERPDLFILGNGVLQPDGQLAINPWERELFQHPEFQANYETLWVPVDRSQPLPCFARRDWQRPAHWPQKAQ